MNAMLRIFFFFTSTNLELITKKVQIKNYLLKMENYESGYMVLEYMSTSKLKKERAFHNNNKKKENRENFIIKHK